MVGHRDLIMYLIAVKSFYRQMGEGEIIVVDDGTLTARDRKLLSHHLGAPDFVDMNSVDTGPCPKGRCWERLFTVLELREKFYVIQLDSDTLTRSAVPEVVECVRSNRCFTLGTVSESGADFLSLHDASRVAEKFTGTHVQVLTEKSLFRLPDPECNRYVRGSAGFAGFAKGRPLRGAASEFSRRISKLIGPKWNDWGSEQITSNYLIANEPSPVVLPQPKYSCFDPERSVRNEVFVHFIGTYRHDGGVYARESRAVIRRQL